MELMMRNDLRAPPMVLRVVNLKLPSKDFLSLIECHCILSTAKNIISISCLEKMGYTLIIKDKHYYIYFRSELVTMTALFNSIYLIDVSSYNLLIDVNL